MMDEGQMVKGEVIGRRDGQEPPVNGRTQPPGFSGEWETRRLGEIASIRNRKILPSDVDPDTLCVELDHIGQGDGRLLARSTAQYSTSSKYRFSAGDVLFGRLRSYLRKFWYADRDGICTTEIWPLMVDPAQADGGFLYFIVQSDRFIEAASISYGTHMPRTDWEVIQNFEIHLPPVQEQRTIAEALSDVDGLLGALEALIAKKQAIKQAAMQQLLTGRTRLPGFSGEWEFATLGEVADIRNGATPSTRSAAYWDGSIPWCTPTDITSTPGKYLFATDRNITAEGLSSCGASLLPAGALLLCSRATIGEIRIAALSMCTNQGFKSLVCKDNMFNEFLYYLIMTLKQRLIEQANGSTFLEIGKSALARIEVRLPPYDEQAAIGAVLSDMDAEIAALERRRDKTRAVKRGMMEQLLTGRVRLA